MLHYIWIFQAVTHCYKNVIVFYNFNSVLFEIVSTRPLSMKPPDRALSSTKVVPLPFRFPTASRALPDDNLKKPLVPFLISTKRDIEKVCRMFRVLNSVLSFRHLILHKWGEPVLKYFYTRTRHVMFQRKQLPKISGVLGEMSVSALKSTILLFECNRFVYSNYRVNLIERRDIHSTNDIVICRDGFLVVMGGGTKGSSFSFLLHYVII